MSFRGRVWVLLISGIIGTYALIGSMPMVGRMLTTTEAQQPINDAGAQLRIVESVLQHIQNDYVDDPNMEKVRLGALRGLAGGLDPYSSFLTADQVKEYQNKTNSKAGIGAEFSQVQGFLYVISVVKGSPADTAGLKSGDVIEYIDGKASRDISLYDARNLVSGAAGTQVALRVLRSGEKPSIIKVTRGAYKIPPVESRVESGKIGIIKVYSLENGESSDIKSQLQNLEKQGVTKVVLDLRGVSAGSLDEGVAVANLFIKDGNLATVVGRENKVTRSFAADPAKFVFGGDVAALIDLGTAGPAEVVASAITDRKRGEVVGERSFGSGTDQQLFTLRSGEGLLLTTAKWASPSGVPFLGDDRATMGVKPSVEVKRPDTPEPLEVEEMIDQQQNQEPQANPTPAAKPDVKKPAAEDIQLKKAIEILQGKAQAAKAG